MYAEIQNVFSSIFSAPGLKCFLYDFNKKDDKQNRYSRIIQKLLNTGFLQDIKKNTLVKKHSRKFFFIICVICMITIFDIGLKFMNFNAPLL